jgi:O-antigen/teichoic acid export membrane protein
MNRIRKFLFKNTTTRQTILKNTFWIGISTTFVKILRAVVIIYAARLLGTEGYGIFSYAMSIAAIFAVASDMGLTSILTREISKDGEKTRPYFATALVIKILMLALVILLIIGVGPFLSRFPDSTTLLPIIALSLVFESLRSFLYAIPRAENRMQTEAGISVLNELFCTALIVGMFLHNPTPESLAFSFMIGNAIGFIIAGISTRRYLWSVFSQFQKKLFKPLIAYTLPFAVLGVFGILMTNIDALIIGYYDTEHALGLFGAAQRSIGVLYILPNFLSGSLFPLLSKFHAEDKSRTVSSMISVAVATSISFALPIIFGGIVIAGPLISVIFGSEYAGSVLAFQILLITLLFVFPGTMLADVLLIENRQRVFLLTSIIGAALNVGLDILLIPRYSIVGSAVATVIAQGAVNTIFYFAVRKRHEIHVFRKIYKSIGAALIMAIGAYGLMLMHIPLIVIVPAAAVVYAGLLFAFNDQIAIELRRSLRREQASV